MLLFTIVGIGCAFGVPIDATNLQKYIKIERGENMRILPFMKPKNGAQFAGIGVTGDSSGGGGSGGIEKYSTTPKKVAEWIDGSDVYEFSFVMDFPTDSSGDIQLFTFASKGASDLDVIIDADITFKKNVGSSAQVNMNYYSAYNDSFRWYTSDDNTSLYAFCVGSSMNGAKIYGTIRYLIKEV